MRPTKGDISVTPASAQAMACTLLNSRVRLVCMPSFSSCSAARIPSQVDATLMSTWFLSTPSASYISINSLALSMVLFVSKESCASASVETLPGTIFSISTPKFTASLSRQISSCFSFTEVCFLAYAMALSMRWLYLLSFAALRISEGLVVASTGLYSTIDWKSPESATTLVYFLSCSSEFIT